MIVIDRHDPLDDGDDEFQHLIEQSSLGTAGARALRKRTTPERLDAVNTAVDRVWSIRDAVLKWLYIKAMVNGHRHPVLDAADIAKTVDWQGDPLTEPEVATASDWLKEEGYITGPGSWGHGVIRPSITPRGEAMADNGKSVRGGSEPAQPQGSVYISGSTNVAVHSPGAQQSYQALVQLEKANEVASALEVAARAPGVPPEVITAAERTAAEIRVETSRPEPDPGKLKQLLFSVMTALAGAFGQSAGTDLAHIASQALQSF
ncbi:MAG TPA: hypothetical protein PLK19_03820 [Mycobacterium sp.]|nr:hypothetical protein [Mycobacterium sp.]